MKRTIQLVFVGALLLLALTAFAAGADQDAPPRFDISGYQVEGNTLIAPNDVAPLLAPYTGKDRDFEAVQQAIEALRKAYRQRGYSTVQVVLPEQELQGGLVKIKVIEARIGSVAVTGNAHFDRENILRSLPGLRQGEVANVGAVSRGLRLANDSPAKKTTLQLQGGKDAGELAASVEVKDEKPWKAGLTFDNTGEGQAGTGALRLGAIFEHANLFDRDHLLTLQYITSPTKPDHVSIYGAGYRVPFYSLGSALSVVGGYSDVDSGTLSLAGSDMQVSGKGAIAGLHYDQNLFRIGRYEHKVSLGLNYLAFYNNVELEGTALGNDVTVHPLSLTYGGTLTFAKAGGGFYVEASHNLPGGWGGKDHQQDFDRVRAGAPEGYTVFRYGANVSYDFCGAWQARGVINGQYTNDALVPGEQFGLGGANSVRGFDEREIANDRGYAGSVEVYTPNLAPLAGLRALQCRALVFCDAGHISRVKPLAGETAHATVASLGPGVRLTDGKYFSLATDYGFIVDPVEGGKARGSGRWHIAASFMY